MNTTGIRFQRLSDARRFCEILNNKNFLYFSIKPTLKDEVLYLLQNAKKRKKNFEHNYTIMHEKDIVGAVGIKINPHTPYIGEIGYFIDENYWNRGIASDAVRLVEEKGFNELDLERLEIVMMTENTGSVRVADKCGYKREGLLRKRIFNNENYHDAYLYAKVKTDYI